MKHDKQLPPVRDLLYLAKNTSFPATRSILSAAAKMHGASQTVLDFLTLYPANEVFTNKVDFMNRSEALELLIAQGHDAPGETAPRQQE